MEGRKNLPFERESSITAENRWRNIGLSIRGDCQHTVDLFIGEALKPKTLTGHELANPARAHHDSLMGTGIQRMGNVISYSPTMEGSGKSKAHCVTGVCRFVSLFRILTDEKNTGVLPSAV